MNIPQELLYQQYVRRELETYRAPYDPEAEFYSYVRQGNTEKVKELCRESFQEKKGLGVPLGFSSAKSEIPLCHHCCYAGKILHRRRYGSHRGL